MTKQASNIIPEYTCTDGVKMAAEISVLKDRIEAMKCCGNCKWHADGCGKAGFVCDKWALPSNPLYFSTCVICNYSSSSS